MLAWLAGSAAATAQSGRNELRAAYVHPAGACRNTTVEITAGGQNLRGATGIRISGTGVEGSIIKSYRQMRNLDPYQRAMVQWHIACRRAEINAKPKPAPPPPPKANPDGSLPPKVEIPENPLLDMLGRMNLAKIEHYQTVLQRRDRMQPNPQLGDFVRLSIQVSADAEPGLRELRFTGRAGLSNPLRFEIGTLPEARELEPNEAQAGRKTTSDPPVPVPCTFNGQIQSGDVDVLRFRARSGQNLVVRGQARALIPYLADAVPGWFQLVLTLRDAKGREVAYGDDFHFDPDPVMSFKVPEDGIYFLEVRDSIYRGREDFVYRISVGELPFVTACYPMGGRQGVPLVATARGWNLPAGNLRLDTTPGRPPLRSTRIAAPSNPVAYAVDDLTELNETEPNNYSAATTTVSFPCIINGRIHQPGDADVFQIQGRKDMELVVEVQARRLRSPLDSLVHVADDTGRVLAWNDDAMDKDGTLHLGDGLLTHHADSRLRVKIPADGPVFVRIADTQGHGGQEFAYRLRLCGPRPDFELRVTPSALNVGPGANAPLEVHVRRNEGFDGEILLKLEDAPTGFDLAGARIPPGVNRVRLTLTTPAKETGGVFSPHLVGTATSGDETISRTAQAADDVMQAFLWRHLAPADEWLVCVAPKRGGRSGFALETPLPLEVPVGSLAEVRVRAEKWRIDRGLEIELIEPPPGIRVSSVRKDARGLAFDVIADAASKPGFESNLIIQMIQPQGPGRKPAAKGNTQRVQLGVLPALPIILKPPTSP